MSLAHSPLGARTYEFERTVGFGKMAATIEQKALRFLKEFERAGKTVGRVTIEGRKIELVLSKSEDIDDFDRIEMRYDKT